MRTTNTNKPVRCSITIDAELLERAKEYAKLQDRNLSSVFRLALKRQLESESK